MYQKMDGEFITTVHVANDSATSMHDRVAVIRDDANRYYVTYPLWFAMERPDRIERMKARATGRRELADVTVHCSIYREPYWRRGYDVPRYSFRASKIRRINVRTVMRYFTAE